MSFPPAFRRVAIGLLLTVALGVVLIQGSSYFGQNTNFLGQTTPVYEVCATATGPVADLLAASAQKCCWDETTQSRTLRCKEGCPAGTVQCPALTTGALNTACCAEGQGCGNDGGANYFCTGDPTPPPPPPSSGSSSSCAEEGGGCSMTSGANGGCCGGLSCSNEGPEDGSGPCSQPGGCPEGTSCSDFFDPPTCFPSGGGGAPIDGHCSALGGGGGGGGDPGGPAPAPSTSPSPSPSPGFPPSPIGSNPPSPPSFPAPSTSPISPKTPPSPSPTPSPGGPSPSPSTSPSPSPSPTLTPPPPTPSSSSAGSMQSVGSACQTTPPTCPPTAPAGCSWGIHIAGDGCLVCQMTCNPPGSSAGGGSSVSSRSSTGVSRSSSSASSLGGGGGGGGGPTTVPPAGPTPNPPSGSASSGSSSSDRIVISPLPGSSASSQGARCLGVECAIFGCPFGQTCQQGAPGDYPQCMRCIDPTNPGSSSSSVGTTTDPGSSSSAGSTSSTLRCTENACRDAGGCPLYFNCRVLLNGTPPNCHVCEPVGASSASGPGGSSGSTGSSGSNGSSGSSGSTGSTRSQGSSAISGSSRSSVSSRASSTGLPTGQTLCGDGIRQAGESCDLGSVCTGSPASCNRIPGTFGLTCLCDPRNTATCTPPPDMLWNQGCMNPRCGDSVVNNMITYRGQQVNGQLIREECDDGNTRDGDGCSSVCVRESIGGPRCGNGRLDSGEQCDDGNQLNTDLCTNQCRLSERVATGPTPTPASTQSVLRCGDGVVTAGEMCDKGSACTSDPASCNRPVGTRGGTCTCNPGDPSCPLLPGISWTKGCTQAKCGDSIVNNWATFAGKAVNYEGLSETCDKGDLNGKPGSGCSQTCSLENAALCGNSKIDPGETCDRGAQNGKPGVACTLSCQSLNLALCGNQILDSGEECDGTEGCSATCQREGSSPLCGNEQIDPGEECDSTQNCSSSCLRTEGVCGDGVVQKLLGEQCEPSTHDPSLVYGCGQDCRHQSEFCGNSVLDIGEQCDDGALNNDSLPDRCRTNCSFSRCGDAILDSAEQCDDGNHRAGDGCDLYCRRESGSPSDSLAQTIDFPVLTGDLTPIATSHPPAGQTGPAALAVMAAGAAAGWAWVRRKRNK